MNYVVTLTLVLWQHVVFLCVSRTVFRMSLVMVVRPMLCSVRHTLHSILRMSWAGVCDYNFSKEQYTLPEDDRVIETCTSVLNVLMSILDLLNYIYIYIMCMCWCMCVCVCVGVCN